MPGSKKPIPSSAKVGTSTTAVTATLPEPSDIWEIWQEALAAIRTSPDHLTAQAARIVAARNPEAIFAFVRDEILTVPPRPDGFGNAASMLRWGIDAVLRCGTATRREHWIAGPTDTGSCRATTALLPSGRLTPPGRLWVLPDGSGGGITSDPNSACKTINQGAAWWDLFGAGVGFPFAYGVFFALQKATMKQTLREAAILASIGGPEPDTSGCGNGPGDVLCDWGKDALTEVFKPLAPLGYLDKFAEASTGSGLFNC